jgi:inhibitor of cysteine peptidase
VTTRSLPVLALLQIAIFCSVATGQHTASAAKPSSSEVILTESDNGRDVDLTTGTTLIVKLGSSPSTGYAWSVAGDPAPLKLQKSSFHKAKAKNGMVGAAGTAVFQLAASSAGMTNLTLVYRRSWEYNVPPMKTFTVRVNVR